MSSEARERALLWAIGRAARRIGPAIATQVGLQELVLFAGLALVGAGLWLVSPAAGLAVPGAVLVWSALPQRPSFIVSRPRDGRREA